MLIRTVAMIGIPTAVIQICLSVASSLTNIAAAPLPNADEIIAAYGVVQRLILIGCYVVMGFMQGYQPVASYAFGAKKEERFHQSVRFALQGSLLLTVLVAAAYILLARPLILLFNDNPLIADYGRWLLTSQLALYPAFGLCYMMTITFQTIGEARYGLFLSMIRQGAVLCAVHPGAAPAVRRERHLLCPARGGRADHSGVPGVDPADEAHRLPAHWRQHRRKRLTGAAGPGTQSTGRSIRCGRCFLYRRMVRTSFAAFAARVQPAGSRRESRAIVSSVPRFGRKYPSMSKHTSQSASLLSL